MDGQRFDNLVRSMAAERSRRALLKGVLGGVLGGAVAAGRARTGAANGTKVVVCHLTGDPAKPVVAIEVGVSAVPAHAAHGDVIAPDFRTDPGNCGGCGLVCADGNACAGGACVEGTCGVNGAMECAGSGFRTCDNGSWVYRDCGPGTSCRPVNGSILCDWPQNG